MFGKGEPVAYVVREQDIGGINGWRGVFQCSKLFMYFYKIQAKHVDFVLCDAKLVARWVIELDDTSHRRADRAERDTFVDEVLMSTGYTILHMDSFDEKLLDYTKMNEEMQAHKEEILKGYEELSTSIRDCFNQ